MNIDRDLAKFICEQISSLYQLDISLYEKGKLLDRISSEASGDSPYDLESIHIGKFAESSLKASYLLTPEFLLFGGLQLELDLKPKTSPAMDQKTEGPSAEENESNVISRESILLILGPVRTIEKYDENSARQIALSCPSAISHSSDLALFQTYLSNLPQLSFDQFTKILSLLWAALTQEEISADEIRSLDSFSASDHKIESGQVLEQYQTAKKAGIDLEEFNYEGYAYEEKLKRMIEHGQAEDMKNYLHSYSSSLWSMGNTPLRHAKNAAIVLNSIALRAAIRGNLPPYTAYALGSINLQRIEDAASVSHLEEYCSDMIYDYCQRVRDNQTIHTSDEKINEIAMWIGDHIREKITVSIIARQFGISREYLSRRFHEVTGLNLSAYINLQKIYEAKRLLALTKMPVIEISNYLSFSSQSYFQTVFKEFEKITPSEYRKRQSR